MIFWRYLRFRYVSLYTIKPIQMWRQCKEIGKAWKIFYVYSSNSWFFVLKRMESKNWILHTFYENRANATKLNNEMTLKFSMAIECLLSCVIISKIDLYNCCHIISIHKNKLITKISYLKRLCFDMWHYIVISIMNRCFSLSYT